MQQTERDLLIRLDTKVEMLIKTVDDLSKKMGERDELMDTVVSRLVAVEEKVQENSKFRWFSITSLIGALISIVLTLLGNFTDVL